MDKLARKSSFTAANAYPFKLFRMPELLAELAKGKIFPVHVQLNPTNKCNLNCSFCSCSKRDRNLELSVERIARLVEDLHTLGCKAVTITGGGEPLMHSQFDVIMDLCFKKGLRIGLVSNGYLLGGKFSSVVEQATWCRVSCSDAKALEGKLKDSIQTAVRLSPTVDWAFSYVVTEKFDPDNLASYISFANNYNFTHVRVVSDLLNLDKTPFMDTVRKAIVMTGVDDSRVIYQGRKEYLPGVARCLISLLKPNIGADGKIYPCCGAQYAEKEPALDYSTGMQMGDISDILEIYNTQQHFNGAVCSRCYYSNYNEVLALLMSELKHVEFA